jgi:D-alanine-D-alanine ligase
MIKEFEGKKIGVIMGGVSAEHKVSMASGEAVLAALKRLGYKAQELVVSDNVISELQAAQIDIAFVALHGGWGEDGRIQSIFELLKIPYTGSGVVASSLAMHKPQAKAIFTQKGIPTPKYCPAVSEEFVFEEMKFDLPFILKPSNEGSTVGVSIVRQRSEFKAALELARKYDELPMVEEYITGREITCGVLDGEPLEVVEIKPKSGFYDYGAKYDQGGSEYEAPAKLPAGVSGWVKELSRRAYDALHCRGGARVDFRVHPERGPFVLEVNTIPGMTSHSLLPMSAAAVGVSFDQLVEKILKSAMVHKK